MAQAAAVCLAQASLAAPLLDEPIKPVPAALGQDPARVDIGRRLFADVRLSVNGAVSCAKGANVGGNMFQKFGVMADVVKRGGSTEVDLGVSDTGEGIAAAHLERIFSYGFTTRRGGHGFGLHSTRSWPPRFWTWPTDRSAC